MTVYQCIAAVSAEIAQTGISKDRKNEQQGYAFRGIDDVYNALAPILAKHGLVILPRMLSREQTERQTAKGGVLFSVVVDAEFDFVSAEDGSTHTTKAFGEAMDSADKATNKAMSAAYKYTAFQTFCIPTEGDNDADATTPDVATSPARGEYLDGPLPQDEPAPRPPTPPRPQPRQPPPMAPPQRRAVESGHGSMLLISEAQAKRYYAIAKSGGWDDDALNAWLENEYGYKTSREIPRRQYDEIVAAVREAR